MEYRFDPDKKNIFVSVNSLNKYFSDIIKKCEIESNPDDIKERLYFSNYLQTLMKYFSDIQLQLQGDMILKELKNE